MAKKAKAKEQPKVRFHLPGLRYNFPVNMLLINLLKEFPDYFRDGVEIASAFGEFPTSLWSGGRLWTDDQCDERFIRSVIQTYNDAGVPIRYTYTNPTITKEELADPYCNFCMEAANNGMNEVMVFSPILEEYIREKYPNYVINSSTCKAIKDVDVFNAELEKDYGLVVLDYNTAIDFDFLEKIKDKGRCEILVNTCCPPNCPRRAKHYEYIGKAMRTRLKNRQLPPELQTPIETWYCEYGENSSLHTILKYPTVIKPEQIWETYVPMGFVNFKIEGRTMEMFNLIETYVYWMVKEPFQSEIRTLLLANLEAYDVLKVNKPKRGEWPSR